jgi:hypothetical protein
MRYLNLNGVGYFISNPAIWDANMKISVRFKEWDSGALLTANYILEFIIRAKNGVFE